MLVVGIPFSDVVGVHRCTDGLDVTILTPGGRCNLAAATVLHEKGANRQLVDHYCRVDTLLVEKQQGSPLPSFVGYPQAQGRAEGESDEQVKGLLSA